MPTIWYGIGAVVGLVLIATSLRILKEYDRAVVFRLGRFNAVKGPGFVLLMPFWIDRMERVSMRTIVQDVTPQDVITKDNVSVSVNAVLWFRVVDPEKAVIEVEDFSFAISNFAQTTLRSVLGRAELDDLLSEREKLNQDLEETIRNHSDDWGIRVLGVEIKHVDLPVEMKRAMAKQAEAERERRAKATHADGELESASTLAEAAKILSADPTSIQLRYLQAMIEVSAEKNSTLIFPVPVDLVSALTQASRTHSTEG
ncbi:MAG: slipin family protein [Candidatus Poribacteria bacterium]|jgi:regulator of protease activity HflC (stomatin/prohibitin superfamily)|nr:slipin family protein [Candidatus Poribacteria bacterium]MDP6748000.1 slipin family protein [Candidatus Poribacteria bacterium]MDP6998349.1 slipin family protein [Candidatus Poribacteria bacterium]